MEVFRSGLKKTMEKVMLTLKRVKMEEKETAQTFNQSIIGWEGALDSS